jgi:hypothetical protein
LLRALIGFDTVTFAPGTPPREEEALQRFLGKRLAARNSGYRSESPQRLCVLGANSWDTPARAGLWCSPGAALGGS